MSRLEHSGGKILGEGNYGCAIYPALTCKDKSIVKRKNKIVDRELSGISEHQVGKLTTLKDAKHEYSISRDLESIPGSSEYFILVDNLCEPAPRAEQTEKDLASCTVLKKTQLPLMTQITMPFGGKPLAMVPMRAASLDFLRLGQQILEGGTLLLMKEIVHYDLHRANILMESKWKAKFIDFGVSWKPHELTENSIPPIYTYFNAKIVSESPEVSVISAIIHGMSIEKAVDTVIQDKLPLRLYGILTNTSIQSIRRTLERFLETSWCFENENWLVFFQLYWSKMDSWSIGVILMNIYQHLLMDPEFTNSESYLNNKKMILDIIENMCSPDAGKRYDCARALSVWAPNSPILQHIDVQQWLEKETVVRKELDPILARIK